MAAGESWVFNRLLPHRVDNASTTDRIHLIFDTVGSPHLFDLMARAEQPMLGVPFGGPIKDLPFDPSEPPPRILTELNPPSVVLSPGDLQLFLERCIAELTSRATPHPTDLEQLRWLTASFCAEWRSLWLVHGADQVGWPLFRKAAENYYQALLSLEKETGLPGKLKPSMLLRVRDFLCSDAFNPELADSGSAEISSIEPSMVRLNEDLLFRLDSKANLTLRDRQAVFRSSSLDELTLLYRIALSAPGEPFSLATDQALSSRVRALVREQILAPAPLAPKLDLERPGASSDQPAAPEPESDDQGVVMDRLNPASWRSNISANTALKLKGEIYFRLEPPPAADLWLWAENQFWSVSEFPVLCSIEEGTQVSELAAKLDRPCDDELLDLIALFMALGLVAPVIEREDAPR